MAKDGQTTTTQVEVDPFAQQSGQNLFRGAANYLNQFGDQQVAGQQPFSAAAQGLLGQGLLGYNPGFQMPQYGPTTQFNVGPMGLDGWTQSHNALGGELVGQTGTGGAAPGGFGGGLFSGGFGLNDAQQLAANVGGYQPDQVNAPHIGPPRGIDVNAPGAPGAVTPQQVQAPTAQTPGDVAAQQVRASQVGGGSFLGGPGIGAYQNPHTDQVVNAALSDIDRSRQLANQQGARSAGASTYGGDRNALIEAETNRGFGDVAARAAAQLRSQGFSEAAGLYGQDLNRGLQAGLANQSTGLQAGMANQGAGLRAALANQGIAGQLGMFNAGNQLDAQLANQGAGLQAGLANQQAQQRAGEFGAGLSFDQQAQNNANQMQAGQFNASNFLQSQLANQQAGLQGAGLNLDAAGLMGRLGGQQFNQLLSGAGALNQMGLQNQQLAQQYINQPLNNFSYLNSMLQGLPFGGSTQTQTQPGGSTWSAIGGGLLSAIPVVGGIYDYYNQDG